MPTARRIWLAHVLVEIPHLVLSCCRIGQFNCDNRSQQHVEAIYGSFDFIGPTEKHPTENGIIAGKSYSHKMILETKQVLFRAHVGLGMHMTIWNRL